MKKVIDIDREEGARILEKELYLHQLVEDIKKELKETFKRRREEVKEFYSSNFFISGKRGTGKTSVLITLKKEIEEDKELKDKVEILETINLSVNQNSLLSYLLSYIKSKLEECSPEGPFLYKDVFPAFSKVMAGYPHFLKCSLEESLKRNCNMEVEEFLDNLEGEFLKNLRILIKNFFKDKNLIILLDDFDLVQSKELLYRTFVEITAFFSMENIHIIAAGDLNNTYKILESFIKDSEHISSDEETAKSIAQSFIDKVFPIYNRFELKTLSALEIRELFIKYNNSEEKLIEFLQKHPTFKILKNSNENLIYYLFENLTMRELVQVLRSISEKIKKLENLDAQEITINDLSVSNILARFKIEEHFRTLEMPYSEEIKIKAEKKQDEDLKLTFSVKEENIDDLIKKLALYNQELGKRFFKSIYSFSKKNEKFTNAFKVESAKDIEEKLKLPMLSMISVIDRNFFAFLVVWLTEVLNYAGGILFFAPYLLLTLAMFYNLPNILVRLELKEDRGKEKVPYRDLISELEYIKDFNDAYELLYTLKSLDSITVRKSYQSLKDRAAKMIFYFDIIKKRNNYRLVPYYFKFWFIPTLAAAIDLEKSELKDLIYDRFVHDFENEGSNSSEGESDFSKKLKEDLKKVREKEEEIIKSLVLTENALSPTEIDRSIHSITRYLINKFFKFFKRKDLPNKDSNKYLPNFDDIRFAFYTFLSFCFFLFIYKPHLYWKALEFYGKIFESTVEFTAGTESGNDEEKLFNLVSRYLYLNSLLANRGPFILLNEEDLEKSVSTASKLSKNIEKIAGTSQEIKKELSKLKEVLNKLKKEKKSEEIKEELKKLQEMLEELIEKTINLNLENIENEIRNETGEGNEEKILLHFLEIFISSFLEDKESPNNTNSQDGKENQGDEKSE